MGRLDLCLVETFNQGFTQSEKSRIPHNSEKGSSPLTVKEGTEGERERKGGRKVNYKNICHFPRQKLN